MVGVTLYLRSRINFSGSGNPYEMHLSPLPVLHAFFKQMAGAVPLLYGALDASGAIATAAKDGDSWILAAFTALAVAAVLGLLWMLRWIAQSRQQVERLDPTILPTAAVLLFFPLIPVCLSGKYQKMSVADSYLPIYLSCFGGALLLGMAILHCIPKIPAGHKRWIVPVFLAAAATAYGWNFRNNVLVVEYINRADAGREAARTAAAQGFFSGLSEDSLILTVSRPIWEYDSFFAEASGHRQILLGLDEAVDYKPKLIAAGANCSPESQYDVCTIAPRGKVFFFRAEFPGPRSTALILSRLTAVILEHGAPRALQATETALFFAPGNGYPSFSPLVHGQYARWRDTDSEETDFWARPGTLTLQGKGWQWFETRDKPVEVTSLKVYLDAPQEPGLPAVARSRPANELSLQPAVSAIIHVGYSMTRWGDGVVLDKLPMKLPLSIELVVDADPVQAPSATIVSSHGVAFGGLTIEQEGTQTNRYMIGLGTGSAYGIAGELSLTPGKRHYAAIELQPGSAAVYIDGKLKSRSRIPSTLAESPLPLRLGNWVKGGRAFSGRIEELLIAPEVRTDAEIQARAAALKVGD